MPEGFPFPFPIPGFGNPKGPKYPGITELIDELLRRRAQQQAAPDEPEPEEPPPNPQVGVVELPPPSSNLPAPLPNPTGDYGPYSERAKRERETDREILKRRIRRQAEQVEWWKKTFDFQCGTDTECEAIFGPPISLELLPGLDHDQSVWISELVLEANRLSEVD